MEGGGAGQQQQQSAVFNEFIERGLSRFQAAAPGLDTQAIRQKMTSPGVMDAFQDMMKVPPELLKELTGLDLSRFGLQPPAPTTEAESAGPSESEIVRTLSMTAYMTGRITRGRFMEIVADAVKDTDEEARSSAMQWANKIVDGKEGKPAVAEDAGIEPVD